MCRRGGSLFLKIIQRPMTFPVEYCYLPGAQGHLYQIHSIEPVRKQCGNHVCVLVTQSCLALCNPMNSKLPGSSVHGILQARILEWGVISSSRGSSRPRGQTLVSCIAGRFFTIWATRDESYILLLKFEALEVHMHHFCHFHSLNCKGRYDVMPDNLTKLDKLCLMTDKFTGSFF